MPGAADMDDEAEALMRLADVLLPGDGRFPPASATAMAPLFAARLHAAGPGTAARVLAAVAPPTEASVARLEAAEPALFDTLRRIAFVTYYEQPAVIAAIRALGMPYNDAPLPAGYAPEPFDPATDAPRHQRGHWLQTGEVRPVDLSPLPHLRSAE